MKIKTITKILWLTIFAMSYFVEASAQPCYPGYDYRTPIVLDNTSNAESKGVQVQLSVNTESLITGGKMKSTGADLRILDRLGNPLDYWIVDGTINTTNTQIWVKTDSIIGYSKDTIYLFYDNPSATAVSNKASTFDMYDDFNGSSLGIGWSTCGSGSKSVASGSLTLTSASGSNSVVESVGSFAWPLIVEMGVSSASGQSFVGTEASSGSGFALVHNGNMGIQSFTSASCFTGTSVNTSVATGSTTGTWSFVWSNSGAQSGTWPGGTTSATSTSVSASANNKIVFGNADGGSLKLDWIRARKYVTTTLPQTIDTEVSMTYDVVPSFNSPICEGQDLQLSVLEIPGAIYAWSGPTGSGFTSTLREPVINGINIIDAGQYRVEVIIPSGCKSKNKTVDVRVTPKSKGGTMAGSTTVCAGSNTGSLILKDRNGDVVSWDSASSMTGPWHKIATTLPTREYLDLSTTTHYRAIVKNGTCAEDTSSIGVISVTQASDGGSVNGAKTVCAGSNSGTVNLIDNVGNVDRWQESPNGFSWTPVGNRSKILAYTNLAKTTFYRAVVKNGLCDEAISTPVKIEVDANSIGGTVDGVTSTCEGDNTGTLKLTNNLGTVVRWETSTTGVSPWTAVANVTDSFVFNNLQTTTYHRAIVKNGTCNLTPSSVSAVSIIPASDGGIVLGSNTVCETANSGSLTADGYLGTITKWQYREVDSSNWMDITNTANTLSWGSLSNSTEYRVIVSNKGCESDSSSKATITVNKSSNSGYLTGTANVCAGTNSGNVTLKSAVGDVKKWEVSNSGFAPWNTINNKTITQAFNNLDSTKYYRAIVKNGLCAETSSNPFKVEVDQQSQGGITSSDLKICAGTNYGLIGLSDFNGDIKNWEKTNDSTNGPWSPVANFTNRQDFRDLKSTTYYRAVIQSGSCASRNSSITTIEVSDPTLSGTIAGDTSFCSGTNSGVIKINDHKGDILRWEYSATGGNPWIEIANTTPEYSYANLSNTTFFKAIVKNGACSQIESPVSVISVFPASSSGVLSSGDTAVCSESNFGILSLLEYEGNIQKWESSKDDGTTWSSINNSTATNYFFNLKENTKYRAIVQNGECKPSISNVLAINVDNLPVGGFVDPNTKACINTGAGIIKLNNYSGKISKWQSSLSQAGPWIDIANDKDELTFINPNTSIYYRVELSGGKCGNKYSQPGYIKVYEKTIAGELVGGGEVCDSTNSGQLLINSNVGEIVSWEESASLGGPWTESSQTTNTYAYFNINKPLNVRAKVQNGVCLDEYTNPITFSINPRPNVDFFATNLCGGKLSEFKDNSTISNGAIADYYWSFSDGYTSSHKDFSKAFLNPGYFVVNLLVRSDKGCTNLVTREIEIRPSPLANFRFDGGLGDGASCTSDTIDFINLTNDPQGVGYTYDWNFGDGTVSTLANPKKVYNTPGTFDVKLKVNDANNCDDSLNRYVTVYNKTFPEAGEDVSVSKGISYKLNASGGLLYRWEPAEYLNNPNISNPVATISESVMFIVNSTDQNGCIGADSVLLSVNEDYRVRPNNVVTPEGNGKNDTWIIKNIENYPNNNISVIDRWGRTVFTVSNYQNDWGVTNEDGGLLMDGTYYYIISFDDSDIVYKGAITVIRNQ